MSVETQRSNDDFMSMSTPTIRIVYKNWGDRNVVVNDLKKALKNKENVTKFWLSNSKQIEKSLAPYVRALADAVVSGYGSGGLEAAKEAAYKYFNEATYGKRKLARVLLPEASDSLQHGKALMLKFSRMPLLTCPGADVCGAHCYALHGNYSKKMVKNSIMRQDAFVRLLIEEVKKRVGGDPALTAGLVGAALAGAVEAAGGAEVVRLHDSGDFNDPIYAAAWMTAAKLLPNRWLYTYTKTFPNINAKVWGDAVQYYWKLFGEAPPKNFAVNLSATSTNFFILPKAAEEFARLGVQTPDVFFYAPGNMARYYRDEDWKRLAESLVEAARRTTGKKLILEIEHGLGSERTTKSAATLPKVVEEVIKYAQSAGVPLRVVVPTTAYKVVEPNKSQQGGVFVDEEKTQALREVADMLKSMGLSHTETNEGSWTKTVGGREYQMTRDVAVFEIPSAGEPVEVFIEPGGEKACTLCRRCVIADYSPQKAFKIELAGAAMAETPQKKRKKTGRRRKKAVVA